MRVITLTKQRTSGCGALYSIETVEGFIGSILVDGSGAASLLLWSDHETHNFATYAEVVAWLQNGETA